MASNTRTTFTPQEMQNAGFDPSLGVPTSESLGFTGKSVQRMPAAAMAMKKTIVGSITYLAFAAPGSAASEADWQARKIDETDPDNVLVTWADGNADYDNVATNLTALTYS